MNITGLIKNIREEKDLKKTLEILVGFANGIDFRYQNQTYKWLQRHQKKHRGQNPRPSTKDWNELCRLIRLEGMKQPVDVNTSLQATKTLMEYEHNKQKALDTDSLMAPAKVKPLTAREVDLFRKRFDLNC